MATDNVGHEEEKEPEAEFTTYVDAFAEVTGLSLEPAEIELAVDEEPLQLTAAVEPEDATNQEVSWASADEEVATVTEEGYVEPVGAGTTEITVTTEDGGYTTTCQVEVTVPVRVYRAEVNYRGQ